MKTQPRKGDVVRNVYNGKIFTVKHSYRQNYAGSPDWTVLFEPAYGQATPWDKAQNLELVPRKKN